MMKRNELHEVNRWNKPAFMPNLFLNGGERVLAADRLASNLYGAKYGDEGYTLDDYMNSPNIFGLSKANNPFSKMNIQGALNSDIGKGVLGVVGGVANKLAYNGISGGLSSGAGRAIGSFGNTIGGVVSQFNPILGTGIQAVSGVLGGGINAAIGHSTNQAKKAANDAGTAQLNNVRYDAGSTDALAAQRASLASVANVQNAHKSGFWNKGWARDRNNADLLARQEAMAFADRSFENAAGNIFSNQINNELANYSAFGGPLDTNIDNGMGAIGYGFMSDYLTNKRRQTEQKGLTNMFAGAPSMFAIGGDLQTHGSDWSDGLMHIDAGGSHEESPYDGVQLGVDPEGIPNLVEEGEVIYNDYVFSNRIELDEEAKKKFHFPKKKDITYAEAAKKLEKEIQERPNDPISRAGFKTQMQVLEEEQERQKQEMAEARAREAFEALSPEEKVAAVAMMQQREQAAQEAQAMQEAQANMPDTQPVTPEEAAMAEQQMMAEQQAMPEQMPIEQLQANVSALGGELVRAGDAVVNEFTKGDRKARRITRRYDREWFENLAKSLGLTEEQMEGFKFDSNDPDANMANFNNIYKAAQYKNAEDTYIRGRRQAKRNELFGDNGIYRLSDNGSKVMKAVLDENGDKKLDENGKVQWEVYDGDEKALLDTFNDAYKEGFKWNDNDAQVVQYPINMEKSGLSYLRYAPVLGGAIGLANDIFNSPDYSRARAIMNLGNSTPSVVSNRYNPTYLTFRPYDIWSQRNRNAANLNSGIRYFANTVSPNKNANVQNALYNSLLADGELGLAAQRYNDERRERVAAHNSGENKTWATLDMEAQKANQNALLNSDYYNSRYKAMGYNMMDEIDNRRNQSLNANLTNLLTSIGNIGEEAYDEDRLKWLEKTGVLKSNYFGKKKYGGMLTKRNKKGGKC